MRNRDVVETIKSTGASHISVDLLPDTDAQNPRRDWDPAGVMVCWHNHYDLGDKNNPFSSPADFEEYAKTAPEMKRALIIPLFLYDHGGITMRAGTGFSCPWDSGQVGYIYFTRAEMDKEWGKGTKGRNGARRYAMAAVEEYADYLEGNVYGYVVNIRPIDDPEDGAAEETDSCWGFIGFKYAKEEARRQLAYAIRQDRKERRAAAAAATMAAAVAHTSA